MSINYGYLFTYGEDGKKLPEKRNLKRAIDNSIYEGVGERDLKIKVFDETLHLIIETKGGSCVMEVILTKEDGTKCQVRKVLHGNVTGVLRPGQTALDHGKTRLHKEYQTGTKDHPQGIYRRITARIVSCQGDGWHHRGHKRRRSRYRSSNAFH